MWPDWEQSTTDENLVDAVMLNTSRIGHGYAIDKHPMVMEVVKTKGIAIELNPISNQVRGQRLGTACRWFEIQIPTMYLFIFS